MKMSRLVSIVAAQPRSLPGWPSPPTPPPTQVRSPAASTSSRSALATTAIQAHYPEADGKVPESEWLAGNPVGFMGPWGTTYPANLRLSMQKLTEEQWMAQARAARRPPMPWFNLRDMSDDDLRAIYRYARSLGPTGEPAPAYVPPGQVPASPYIVFEPQNLPVKTASGKVGH